MCDRPILGNQGRQSEEQSACQTVTFVRFLSFMDTPLTRASPGKKIALSLILSFGLRCRCKGRVGKITVIII